MLSQETHPNRVDRSTNVCVYLKIAGVYSILGEQNSCAAAFKISHFPNIESWWRTPIKEPYSMFV